jgi:hypothetical protein
MAEWLMPDIESMLLMNLLEVDENSLALRITLLTYVLRR